VITRHIAEIDAYAEHCAEASLGMLVETQQATEAGVVGATLLAQSGAVDAACETLAAAAREEPYAPLSALLWLAAAELRSEPRDRAQDLDEAVAQCPDLSRARWARLRARLFRGDLQGARADAESLEAASTALREKHSVSREAAEAFLEAGYVDEARATFTRALRYLPSDVKTTLGLARSMRDAGQLEQSTALFERALRLASRHGEPEPKAVVEFAKLLASHVRDLPAAIARVRQVAGHCPAALEARALEALWRTSLGDIEGASLAYARLRAAADLCSTSHVRASRWLVEAARFEQEVNGDLGAAERHLGSAVRLDPTNPSVLAAYRRAAAAVAARRRLQNS
jgi:tetratricopeptide (TPR) repeat protein